MTAIIPQDSDLRLPAAMEGATAFEVYVFMHQNDRTIGQIKKVWPNKGIQQIRDAMDKALRLGWPYIPAYQLPRLPNDGLRYDGGGLGPESKDKNQSWCRAQAVKARAANCSAATCL